MKSKKLSKINRLLIPIVAIVFIFSLAFATYAIYKSSATGISGLKTAAWKIAINDENVSSSNTFDFNLKDAVWTGTEDITPLNDSVTVIAPGSTGVFGLEIDTDGTEVDVKYEVSVVVKQGDTVVDLYSLNPNLTIGIYKNDNLQKNPSIGLIKAGNKENLEIKLMWEATDTDIVDAQDISIEDNTYKVEVTIVTKQMPITSEQYPEGKIRETVEEGDLVKIANEEFYVVKREGDDIILVGRYNLRVGGIYNGSSKMRDYTEEDEGYGLQGEEAVGYNPYESTSYGLIKFSDEQYWSGKVGEGLQYDGTLSSDNWTYSSYPYVYDENSNLYPYLENYKDYLEGLGLEVKEARILKLSEFNYLTSHGMTNIAYMTTSWTGSVRSVSGSIWFIGSNHNGNGYTNGSGYNTDSNCGVRPVIVI